MFHLSKNGEITEQTALVSRCNFCVIQDEAGVNRGAPLEQTQFDIQLWLGKQTREKEHPSVTHLA